MPGPRHIGKCCCTPAGPCQSPYIHCRSCDVKWVPRWRLQYSPGVQGATAWTLTRTGDSTWGYSDSSVTWTMEYLGQESGGLQRYLFRVVGTDAGGDFVDTTAWSDSGTPTKGLPLIALANDLRVCAMGAAVPKEFIITVSGVSLCGSVSGYYLGGTLTVDQADVALNGTFVVPNTGRAGDECGRFSLRLGTIRYRFTPYSGPDEYATRDVILGVGPESNSIPYMGVAPLPSGWFGDGIPRRADMFVGQPSAYCDAAITVANGNTACYPGPGTSQVPVGYGGQMTITPIHDDGWVPPLGVTP